jgi:hypothetical protein
VSALAVTGYIIVGLLALKLIATIVILIRLKPPDEKAQHKSLDLTKARCNLKSITFCDENPYDPHFYKVSTTGNRQRGKLKKSKWSEVRKARNKENRL